MSDPMDYKYFRGKALLNTLFTPEELVENYRLLAEESLSKATGSPPSTPTPKTGNASSGGWYPAAGTTHGSITGNSNIVTSNSQVGGTFSGNTVSASIPANVSIPQYATDVEKIMVRYIIVKTDYSTLELKEQPQITAREMIGICKFISLVPTFQAAVLGLAQGEYNFSITWSKLIAQLGIQSHFVDGPPHGSYSDADEVLNIYLFDPS